jgi:hypothetical protein
MKTSSMQNSGIQPCHSQSLSDDTAPGHPTGFETEGERERQTRKWGVCVVAIGTTFNGKEHKFRFAATKVPRQCPLVLLAKVGLAKVRRLEVEKVG